MVRDLRHAVRVLLEARGWTLVVLVSLALGIGANTALFSAVDGLLLETVPVADPDGLVRLRWAGENEMGRNFNVYGYVARTVAGERASASFSYPAFEAMRAGNDTLDDMFAAAPSDRLSLIVGGRAEIGSGFFVTGGYFDVGGVPALLGRVLDPEDDRPGASPVGVISHRFWARRFGLDPDVLGRTITVNATPVTIVGVLPPGYTGVLRATDEPADMHLPLALFDRLTGESRLADATFWWLLIMGRMKPGMTPAQVQGDLEGIFRTAAHAGMDAYLTGLTAEQRSLSENRDRTGVPELLVDSGRRGVYDPRPESSRQALLLGIVVVLALLIVCANVATLLLSRAATRRREIVVRLSVGATRGRLVRQLVTESCVLAVVGGALGIPVAIAAKRFLPFGQSAPVDWRMFAFVVALSLATGVICSLVPALRATRLDLSEALKEHSRSVVHSGTLVGKTLLVAQVAVSLLLLVGAGLFLRTLANLRSVDVGFDPENVLLIQIDPTLSGHDRDQAIAVFDRIADGLRALPGVRSVGLTRFAFLSGAKWTSTLFVQGRTDTKGSSTHTMTVSPDFFETMRIPVITGRTFETQDRRDGPGVLVINATAARELFGGENPLGRRVGFSPEERDRFEVIGVVHDVKYATVREDPPPTTYRSTVQSPLQSGTFIVRTTVPPQALVTAVREIVRRVDPTLPLLDVSTQAAEIEERFSEERLFALAYVSFGGLALLLASIGLFGLASYGVARRTNEIGIRMALGAEASRVARMVLGESLALVAIGVAIGVGAVTLAGRLVASLLFELTPTDPLAIAQAAGLLVAVAALAAYLPARRAARVDPMLALRCE